MESELETKKKIGLLLHPYGEKEAAGLGRSIYCLVKAIIESDPDNHYTVFIQDYQGSDPVFQASNYSVVRFKKGFGWLTRGFFSLQPFDAYVFFTPVRPFFKRLHNCLVVVHDFSYRKFAPQNMKERISKVLLPFLHGRALRKASCIVSVSEATKQDIIHYYQYVSGDKIKVIYNGFNPITLLREEKSGSKFHFDAPFFLFVGVLKKRKNVVRLIEAFELFKKKTGLPHLLVFAGKGGDREVVEVIEKSAYASSIKELGYVSENDLLDLYKMALVFVFPSLLEGFGMPILEAMSCGIPVLTSDRGATKEIAGEAAYLVDPYSIDSIAEGLSSLAEKNDLRIALIEKGKKRAAEFSWAKSGREYINTICDMLA